MWWPAVVKSDWELRLDYGRSQHAYVNQRLQIQLEGLMMSGVTLETCWDFNEWWNNEFRYKVASCWLFIPSHTTMHGSMNFKISWHIGLRFTVLFLNYDLTGASLTKAHYKIPLNNLWFNRVTIITDLFRNETQKNATPCISWFLTFVLRHSETQSRSFPLLSSIPPSAPQCHEQVPSCSCSSIRI
jgi:hypothetical protein